MKIDLVKGISFQIEGEMGQYNTLPIEVLVKIAEALQSLLKTIAQTDINTTEPLHLENFRVELSGFQKGSAVPQFVFTPRVQTSIADVGRQRRIVNQRFEKLMGVASKGDFAKITEIYPDPTRRNMIVEDLYEFTNSFGNSPVAIVNFARNKVGDKLYKIRQLKPDVKNRLITKIVEEDLLLAEEEQVGTVKVSTTQGGKQKRKIQQLYKKTDAGLSYVTDRIVHNGTTYLFNYPLRSALLKEDDYYVIENEMLDIVGTGTSEIDAKASFAEEFDYIYTRYNELDDSKLTGRIIRIKTILGTLVKSEN
jgi:hypothetical protein